MKGRFWVPKGLERGLNGSVVDISEGLRGLKRCRACASSCFMRCSGAATRLGAQNGLATESRGHFGWETPSKCMQTRMKHGEQVIKKRC